jgi:proteasome lid subunit RPN8/RPN11
MNDNDDFSIELGESVRRHIEHKKSPAEDAKLIAMPYDSPDKDSVPIFITEHVMRSIEQHVGGELEKEVGGVLLGGYCRGVKGAFIEITDFIEAKAAVGTDVSLTFTHQTWAYLNEEQSRRGSGAGIVGWYHSHPALGVFMSKEDQFIHSNYFTEPWHIALVVDPVSHNWGCFRQNDGDLLHTGGFYVYGEKRAAKRVREYVKQTDSARKATPRSASARGGHRR